MAKKKASDFRYNTGETKVPWAAVGENYNAEDLMAIVKFMMKGDGEEYAAAVKAVEEAVYALDKVSDPPAKLSLDAEVAKAEEMCDEFLNTEGCLFVTNCTAGFEIASKYADLKPGDYKVILTLTGAWAGYQYDPVTVTQDTPLATVQIAAPLAAKPTLESTYVGDFAKVSAGATYVKLNSSQKNYAVYEGTAYCFFYFPIKEEGKYTFTTTNGAVISSWGSNSFFLNKKFKAFC